MPPCLDCQQILFTQTSSGSSSAPTRAACTGVARTAWPQSASASWMHRAWKSLNAIDTRTKKSPRSSPGRNSCRQMGTFLRRSLKCLQVQRTEMQCCRCFHIKVATYLMPQMVTMLANGIVRLKCQDEVRKEGQVYAIAVAVGKDRGHKEKGLQTCRSKDCKRKWTKPSSAGAKRQRYCPACRKR